MSVLSSLFTTFLPPLVILLVVFSPVVVHLIVTVLQGVGKLGSRVPAVVRRQAEVAPAPALQPAI